MNRKRTAATMFCWFSIVKMKNRKIFAIFEFALSDFSVRARSANNFRNENEVFLKRNRRVKRSSSRLKRKRRFRRTRVIVYSGNTIISLWAFRVMESMKYQRKWFLLKRLNIVLSPSKERNIKFIKKNYIIIIIIYKYQIWMKTSELLCMCRCISI